ncbi:MAG: electron transfer flavoprotein subunit alpha/FixB family protein [Chloroflexota bacterium]
MPPVILVVAEVAAGHLARLSTEAATFARDLAAEAGGSVLGVIVDSDPGVAAGELAAYLPRVVAVTAPSIATELPAPHILTEVRRLVDEGVTHVVLGASVDGRDVAGALVAFTGWGYLANADSAAWSGEAPVMTSNVLAGKAVVHSTLATAKGVLTVRPMSVTAAEAGAVGVVEARSASGEPAIPAVVVLDRVTEGGAAVSLEEARVVVTGGRGVGSIEGFAVVEDLADALGGVVGASRAAVDAGWIPYARQVGQTGRIVKPALYLSLGVSGAMQHRVGMQNSETIVAVNKDRDAPMAEVADLFVIGDLFEVAPALAAEIRSRRS